MGVTLVVVMGGTVIMMVCWHRDLWPRWSCLGNGVAYSPVGHPYC